MSDKQQPRNILEQIAFGLQTVNDNILDLYKMTAEIHAAITAEPKSTGTEVEK